MLQIICEYSQAITRSHKKCLLSQNHVPITISIKCSTQSVGSIAHCLHKVSCIGEVRVRVTATEVRQDVGFNTGTRGTTLQYKIGSSLFVNIKAKYLYKRLSQCEENIRINHFILI